VQQGGHLILSARTGQKDRTGKLWEAPWAGPILDLIGAKVAFYDLLPESVTGTIDSGGQRYEWNNWADVLEPLPGTEVWATYTNQYYAGKAAVVSRRLGKGTVTYVGPDTDSGALEKAVLRKVYQQAGIALADLPDGVILDWRDGFWVGLNYSDKPYTVPVSAQGKVLIGSPTMKPAEVVVWKE